jgi:signal transduction histidine kinase
MDRALHSMSRFLPVVGTTRGTRPPWSLIGIYAISIFALTAACILLTRSVNMLPPLWLPNAVITYAVLSTGRRTWPLALVVGALAEAAGHLAVGEQLAFALLLPPFDMIEALMIALPIRMMRLGRDFARPRSLLVFYPLGAFVAPAICGFLAALFLHITTGSELLLNAFIFIGAKALAEAVLTPLLMTVRWRALKEMFGRSQITGTIFYVGIFAVIIILNEIFVGYPFAFFFFPAAVLLTFQRGFAGGAIGTVIAGVYLLIPVLLGQAGAGFREHSIAAQVEIVQGFAVVIGFSVLLVGAALDRRRNLERGLAEAHEAALVARDAAETASRAKSMFLANMSHELRTPLNAVIGFSELMHSELYGPLGNQRYREYAGQIHEAGRHLLDLIGDILDMSKIEAGKYELVWEDVAMDVVVGDCIELMRERAGKADLGLSSEVHGYQVVHADRRAIKQILLNLLSNAVKFTGPGGRVIVRSSAGEGKFVLSVSDTGVGIPPEELARLGNPFVQLRATAAVSQQGTGLGLALVRGLAEMHEGTMRIESENGKGTTVSVDLPLRQTAARLAA